MNTFGTTKTKPVNPKSILGGALGFFEEDFESERSLVSSTAKGFFEAVIDLGKNVAGTEDKPEQKQNSGGALDAKAGQFPSKGSIEFSKAVQKEVDDEKKKQVEISRKRIFFTNLKEDRQKVQIEKDRVFEEEINDIVTNLPTEQKNRLLHYQASYKDKSVYQRAELRKKIIEEQRKSEEQEKQASIPNPTKASAINAAMEGGSGTQGGGQANLSAQAVG